MNPPQFLFLQVNDICNLRCQHCCYWRPTSRSRKNDIPFHRKLEIIKEFSELNPHGIVVTCGGESMLDENYFELCKHIQQLKLRCFSVVNGTRITTPDDAVHMLQEGPDEISVSLDSHRSELHDRLRGVRGSFMSAVKALKLLIEARTRVKIRHGRIHAMLLVTSDNYTELDPAYDFVLNELRADKLKLNFLQPTIGYMGNIDYFFKHHSRMNPDKLEKHLQLCNAKYGLKMNPSWIALTRMYAASICDIPQNQLNWVSGPQTREPICNSYERNITVNLEGVARLCFSEYYPGTRLERPGDLTKFWESSGPLRTIMTGCRYLCGISHSVRKESCTIQETNT